ncbi:cytochrome c oxidase assembly protein [Streptomyces sp. TRM43335]|uniref:Cytochrome c oxidase assembly protein n=1 Tax=Streptomyces taklimakanensis TaxID=2569853 RepID=A0A6G2BK32_9ACTN|nr:cytochrome c oxidase assembly protein [Streptomyces taklimakanensis]MTE22252.1 cytochrome c oxidase assembly protein [Streptomyces taklimakanensis]
MTSAHAHPTGTGPGFSALVAAAASSVAVVCYLLAAARLRRRGDAWPPLRDVCFATGGAALAAAAVVTPPGGPFTVHMARHLVVGMAAPLLLVLARPLTLALRALRPGRVRRALAATGRSRPAAWLLFPPTAAVLDVGGLWLLYRTPLWSVSHERPLLQAAVHFHVLAAGLLFAFAVCAVDPVRHRWGLPWRGAALLGAGAAHAVLAKSLYAAPPAGTAFAPDDRRAGALLMYYGGDAVELALAAVLAVGWYAAGGRAPARGGRSRSTARRPRLRPGPHPRPGPRPSGFGTTVRAIGGYPQDTTREGVTQRSAEQKR